MFRMHGIYVTLAAMSYAELQEMHQQLRSSPDPWAVGARKMIEHEIEQETRHRNKIYTF